jgi:hypothetical protein
MDEETPHLHIEFVPLTADGRLSAKVVLGGRVDLQRMQDDFYQKVGKPWGLERGERADLEDPEAKKPRKHLETAELKQKTAAEVKVLEAKKAKLEAECKIIAEHHAVRKERVKAITADYNAKAEKYNQGIRQLHTQGYELTKEVELLKQEKAELREERPYKNRCETLYEPYLRRHFGIDLPEDKKKWLYYAIADKINGSNEHQHLYGNPAEQVQQSKSMKRK